MRINLATGLLIAACLSGHARGALVTVSFDELNTYTATGATGSYYNGDSGIGSNTDGWSSSGVFFNNSYSSDFGGFWSGWSYSNVADSATAGFANQYAAFPGGGVGGAGNYAVAFSQAVFDLPADSALISVSLSATTYTALYARDGLSPPFAAVSPYAADDFFDVVLTGFTAAGATGAQTGSVTHRLMMGPNPPATWQSIDLTALGNARSVEVSFASSDVGPFGIDTPTYVAIDNLTFSAVPEPGAFALAGLVVAGALPVFRRRRS